MNSVLLPYSTERCRANWRDTNSLSAFRHASPTGNAPFLFIYLTDSFAKKLDQKSINLMHSADHHERGALLVHIMNRAQCAPSVAGSDSGPLWPLCASQLNPRSQATVQTRLLAWFCSSTRQFVRMTVRPSVSWSHCSINFARSNRCAESVVSCFLNEQPSNIRTSVAERRFWHDLTLNTQYNSITLLRYVTNWRQLVRRTHNSYWFPFKFRSALSVRVTVAWKIK